MRVIFISIFLLACSLNLFTQNLPNSQLNKILLTVEAFLNNEITPYNEYAIISIHEWNKMYHNGYSPVHQDFSILTYPYKEIFDLIEMTENMIIISISPNNDSIIIQVKYINKFYGFHTEIINANKRKNLGNIPYEVHEND
jgi:hypothetical protein